MIIQCPRVWTTDEGTRVEADILFEHGEDESAQTLYFERHGAGNLAADSGLDVFGRTEPSDARAADAALAALTPLALVLGEPRIRLEGGAVSTRLLEGLGRAQAFVAAQLAERPAIPIEAESRPIEVEPGPLEPRGETRTRPGHGLLFSAGVDSLATLWEDLRQQESAPSVSELVFVGGLNTNDFSDGQPVPERRALFDRTRARLAAFASELGLDFVSFETNIRALYPSFDDWEAGFAAGTLAGGLAFGHGFDLLSISSTGGGRAIGSHPDLDPLFSTEYLEVRHAQGSWTRHEKLASLADWPVGLNALRTCYHIEIPERGLANCGRCEKCMRTMAGLVALGRLEKCDAFEPDELTADDIERIQIRTERVAPLWRELVEPLESCGRRDLADAVRERLRAGPGITATSRRVGLEDVGLIAVVPDRWDAHWQRRHHLLSRMTRHVHVGWVAPAEHWRYRKQPQTTIAVPDRMVVRDASVGLPTTNIPAWLAPHTLARRVRSARRELARRGCRRFILEIWRPEYARPLDLSEYDLTCYHVDDEYSWKAHPDGISAEEQALLEAVDQVFVTSEGLYEPRSKHAVAADLVPNGVDFSAYATPVPEPSELAGIPRPIAGYVGVIKYDLNWPLLAELAERRPDWSFVMLGPVQHEYKFEEGLSTFRALPNAFVLPGRAPLEAAAFPQHFDACLMPYDVDTHMGEHGYPLKLHEYLASGSPAIGSPIRALRDFDGSVMVADGVDAWSEALDRAVSGEALSGAEERQAIARQHDWDALADTIAELLARRLRERED